MIWIGEEDQLRIISIVKGTDLGAVDASLHELLSKIEGAGLKFAYHGTYGVITTCPTNMDTGKRQSILGEFPNITESGKNEKRLKDLARQFGLQARGMGGEHSAMDANGTADISPSARFGVKESYVTEMLYKGLINLYFIEQTWNSYSGTRFLADCRKKYLNVQGNVDWGKVRARWAFLKTVKESLANKYFTSEVEKKASTLSKEDQHRLLDIMMGGLENDDSSVGAYATRPEDYDAFAFYLEPLIKEYHKIQGNTKQEHDWNIPVGQYLLTNINPALTEVSMRARVARNVAG